jgi:hypothetical protein
MVFAVVGTQRFIYYICFFIYSDSFTFQFTSFILFRIFDLHMYSRNGIALLAPNDVISHFPATNFIDGEMWCAKRRAMEGRRIKSISLT